MKCTMRFRIYGHKNTLSKHRNTVEFTKEDFLTKKGDCILGIKANYNLKDIDRSWKKIRITISIPARAACGDTSGENASGKKDSYRKGGMTRYCTISDSFTAEFNPDFSHDECMVIRKSVFLDYRTFATASGKAACDIDRVIVEHLMDDNNYADVEIGKEED